MKCLLIPSEKLNIVSMCVMPLMEGTILRSTEQMRRAVVAQSV